MTQKAALNTFILSTITLYKHREDDTNTLTTYLVSYETMEDIYKVNIYHLLTQALYMSDSSYIHHLISYGELIPMLFNGVGIFVCVCVCVSG